MMTPRGQRSTSCLGCSHEWLALVTAENIRVTNNLLNMSETVFWSPSTLILSRV